MKNLSNLIQRFSTLLDKKTLVKESVAAAIKEATDLTVSIDKISINDSVLEINTSPAVKSEIMLKANSILSELKNSKGIHLSRILYK